MTRLIAYILILFTFITVVMQAFGDTTGYEMPPLDKALIKRADDHITRGCNYADRKAWKQAMSEFRKAKAISPLFFNAGYNIARTHLLSGNLDDAARELEELNALFKDNIAAYTILGQIRYEQDRKEEALGLFEKAVKNGEMILERAELPQAKIDIALAYHNLGSLQSETGEIDAAIESLKKSIAANDNNFFSYYTLGTFLARTGKVNEAIESFRKSRELNSRFVSTDIEMARAYLSGNPPNVMFAISTLRTALGKAPDNPLIHELLGNCYIIRDKPNEEEKLRDYAEAMKHYRNALNLDKDNPQYRVLLAEASALAGEFDSARAALDKIDTVEDTLSPRIRRKIHLVQGHIHKSQGKWVEAGEEYLKASKADTTDYSTAFEAANCFYRGKEFNRAGEILRDTLESVGDTPATFLKVKVEEARQLLEIIESSD